MHRVLVGALCRSLANSVGGIGSILVKIQTHEIMAWHSSWEKSAISRLKVICLMNVYPPVNKFSKVTHFLIYQRSKLEIVQG